MVTWLGGADGALDKAEAEAGPDDSGLAIVGEITAGVFFARVFFATGCPVE
jgi:hypothetical protein